MHFKRTFNVWSRIPDELRLQLNRIPDERRQQAQRFVQHVKVSDWRRSTSRKASWRAMRIAVLRNQNPEFQIWKPDSGHNVETTIWELNTST
jgi:hypothetical protein